MTTHLMLPPGDMDANGNDVSSHRRLAWSEVDRWRDTHPDALILDARDHVRFTQGHLEHALRLDGRNHESLLIVEPKHRPVLIYCYHGQASQTYAEMFRDFGFRHVVDVIGGWASREECQQ